MPNTIVIDSETQVETYETTESSEKKQSNAQAIRLNAKLPDDVKSHLKKDFGAHWNDEEKSFTIPSNTRDFVDSFLEKAGIEFHLDPVYDHYHDLSESEKKASRLEDFERFSTIETIKKIASFTKLLEDFNSIHGTSFKIDDLQNNSQQLQQFESSCTNRQTESLNFLREQLSKLDQQTANVRSIEKKIEEVSSFTLEGIVIEPGKIYEAVDSAENILSDSRNGVFQRSKNLVQIIEVKNSPTVKIIQDSKYGERALSSSGILRDPGSLSIEFMNPLYLSEKLTKLSDWLKFDSRSEKFKAIDCPEKVSRHLIARKQWEKIPVLRGIIRAPTIRSDGSILQETGYDPITGLFFKSDTTFPEIPETPSKEDAIEALKKIEKLLEDFPFVDDVAKSVALSAILTALIRKSLPSAPIFGFSAPKMGSGKSLLSDVVSLIATGKRNSVLPPVENETEERKRLMAVLLEGDPVVCYDNIEQPFGSSALCCVLTQPEFRDRILGITGSATAPTDITFLATGNNLQFVGDLSTRALICKIDSQVERPEERSFNLNLYDYIPKNRADLVTAALTIIRAFHYSNETTTSIKPYGRFEVWSDIIRSSIMWLGREDPCKSRVEIENADPVRIKLRNLFSSWYDLCGDCSYKIRSVIDKAKSENSDRSKNLLEALFEISTENRAELNTRSLGKFLSKHENRIEGGFQLKKMQQKHQGTDLWKIVKFKN